ncbi:MAG TPA: glycosyl hydrolase [Blastocatellia bacterium]|nr:glycosyl hydrolase [Blastocatellia bacterium]
MQAAQRILTFWLFTLLFCLLSSGVSESALTEHRATEIERIAELQQSFKNPPDDSRIMMRWWWFGPAVSKAEIDRELRLMKEGGIGGVEVQPVYPLMLDHASTGIKNLSYLSDEFIEVLRFAAHRADELGLRFDLTVGSGWPYGGPQISIADAAGKLRVERVNVPANVYRIPLPAMATGEKLLAVFAMQSDGKSINRDSLNELSTIRDGAVILNDDTSSPLQIQFFIASRTGMQVKRPAVGAEGFVLNHLDRTSVEGYLKRVGDRLMQAFDANRPYAVFCDSLEVYNSDWTDDFLDEFKKRRGYDLKPSLPALVNDLGQKSLSIRHDWGQTLTELLNERFLQPLQDWSHKNRTRFRVQCYGTPAAALSSNAYGDLSEGEGHQWKRLSATRWASSANHIFGRKVTSSETWTWLHSPSFRATPLDIKAEADLHFLQGVNQLIGHGWPYTAPVVEYPGWRFYAAGVFNEKNPWWIVMPDVAKYLQRVSFLMRQGEPKNDIAIYLPNDDAWSSFNVGNANLIETLRERVGTNLIPTVLESGYNFDFFDDQILAKSGRVENGSLRLGSNQYKIVILPNVEQIPTRTLMSLVEFARTGGLLIATRRTPSLSPGFQAKISDHQRISDECKRLFEGNSAPGHLVVDEKVELGALLTSATKSDLTLSPATPDIGFIHRTNAEAEIYFVANTGNTLRRTNATFRVAGLNPEWWDPMSGEVRAAQVSARNERGVSMDLTLEPYESRVIVFSRRDVPRSGRYLSQNSQLMDLSEDWQVAFGANPSVRMANLRSWTDDERTKFYSGTAQYEKSFMLNAGFFDKRARVRLDFGQGQPVQGPQNPRANGMQALLEGPIRESAVVYVNGRRAGSVWRPPYSIDITDYLRTGENRLRIVVANTAINHMAGHALPDYKLLNLRYGERFQPQDMDKVQPIPSGLVGKVTLIAALPE